MRDFCFSWVGGVEEVDVAFDWVETVWWLNGGVFRVRDWLEICSMTSVTIYLACLVDIIGGTGGK